MTKTQRGKAKQRQIMLFYVKKLAVQIAHEIATDGEKK
jgi:hypothetical protein